MNRAEFMQKLGALLGDVEINERTDALKYYADYFDDAGEENESKVSHYPKSRIGRRSDKARKSD